MDPHSLPVQPKNRTTAILLAVFLSFWSWLYTYQKDKKKFWIALLSHGALIAMLVLLIVLSVATRGSSDVGALGLVISLLSILLGILASLMPLGILVWTIIDVAGKSDAWYEQYPNEPQPPARQYMN